MDPKLMNVCDFIGLTAELCVAWMKSATLYCEAYLKKYGNSRSSAYSKALVTPMSTMDSWFGWGAVKPTNFSHLRPNQLTLGECMGLAAKYGATTEKQVGDNLTSGSLESVIWCILIATVNTILWGVTLAALYAVFGNFLKCIGGLRDLPLPRLIYCLCRVDYLPFELMHNDMWNLAQPAEMPCDCRAHRKEVKTLVVKRLPNISDLFPEGCTRTLLLKMSRKGYAVEMMALRKSNYPMPLYRKFDSDGSPFSRLTMREAFNYIGYGDPHIHVIIVFDSEEKKRKAKQIEDAPSLVPLQSEIITSLMDCHSANRLRLRSPTSSSGRSSRSQSVEGVRTPLPTANRNLSESTPNTSKAAAAARNPTSPNVSPRRNAFQHVTAKVNTNLKKPKRPANSVSANGDGTTPNVPNLNTSTPSETRGQSTRILRSKSQDRPIFRNY